jgi:SAM-dependent methyltransferase
MRKIANKIFIAINRLGRNKQCYICGETFFRFRKWRGGSKNVHLWIKSLNAVGSDTDNFGCFYCGSFDRLRHIFMFFDKLDFWPRFSNAHIIHFAPEALLSKKIEECHPAQYVKADMFPWVKDIEKIDLTNIAYNDETFDIFICNHVLEHVPDYKKALREIYRVLQKGGIAILQTPYSRLLVNNFEDPGINTDELRTLYYGQEDHVRCFSERQFFQGLVEAGFILTIVKHADYFTEEQSSYFGVNKAEDLIMVVKEPLKNSKT